MKIKKIRKIALCTLLLLTGSFLYSQTTMSKKLPAFKDLPKNGEMKIFFELPAEYNYKVFDSSENLCLEGKGQFIDMTTLKQDTYYIEYADKRESYILKDSQNTSTKEGSVIYELPQIYDYKIYNSKGSLCDKGVGKLVDVTEFKNGNYFIKFGNKTKVIVVSHNPEKESVDPK